MGVKPDQLLGSVVNPGLSLRGVIGSVQEDKMEEYDMTSIGSVENRVKR